MSTLHRSCDNAFARTLLLLASAACAAAPTASSPPPVAADDAAAVANDGTLVNGVAWIDLFDGRTLGAFSVTDYGGQGEVAVRNGRLHLGIGNPLTGVTWTGAPPRGDYELELVARREQGNDFFAALTFPVGSECLTLVLGGWGGSLCGLSSLDGLDASRNDTRQSRAFPTGRDVQLRLLVTADLVQAELDGALLLRADLRGRRLSLRPEVELSRPLGLIAFASEGSIARLRWRTNGGGDADRRDAAATSDDRRRR